MSASHRNLDHSHTRYMNFPMLAKEHQSNLQRTSSHWFSRSSTTEGTASIYKWKVGGVGGFKRFLQGDYDCGHNESRTQVMGDGVQHKQQARKINHRGNAQGFLVRDSLTKVDVGVSFAY